MKKLFTMLMLLTFISSTLMAVPAKRTPRTFTQPDGTTVTVVLQGDEHFHYYATTDGVMVKEDTNGYMKYAVTNSEGNIIPGEYKAKNPSQRNEIEKAYISNNKEKISERTQTIWRKSPMRKAAKIGSNNFPNKGEIRGLIIMVEFKDKKFSKGGTQEEFTKMMNEASYQANEATGSARDYFLAQSHNEFQPTFDVVGPVTLSQNMSYYGEDSGGEGNDKNPGQMVVDACKLAKSQFNLDFSKYDLDNDKSVDLVYILYAGYGQAQGAPSYTIWPHAWSLDGAKKELTLDNKKINNYACSSELYGNQGTVIDGIGTFCHEFSHCLGLPDMYDTNYGGNFGMAEWDIMDAGSYNNRGKTPSGYSAFERSSVGWMELEELNTPQDALTLEALNTSNKAYMIKSSVNANEYFVLENRQLTGWDSYLPNHGLLITHIDYQQDIWDNNSVNDEAGHQRVIIVPADNKLLIYDGENDDDYLASLEGDVYPGTSGNTSFTDTSKPAATLYKGGKLGKPVTNIKEENGVITFNFMEGIIASPVLKDASNVSATGFTVNWEAIEGVDSYSLTIKEASNDPDENLVLKEDFTGFTSSSDGTADISSDLDTYMNSKGWKGSKIYNSSKRCKMGSGKGAGVLTSPALDLSTGEGAITVYLKASEYGTTENKLTVKLLNPSGSTLEEKTITLPTSIITFTKGDANCKISFTAGNRAYISHIAIYTGDYEESDLSEAKAMTKAAAYNQTIDGITDTYYLVNGLNPNTTYSYKVSAKKGNNSSEYSNSAKVTTLDPTGIDCNPTELYNAISTNGNHLYVSTEEGSIINIYSIDGILKQSVTAQEGENQIELSNGIYIVRVGNASAKVIISAQ